MEREPTPPRVIWKLEDPWRDLTPDLRAETVTVVTSSLATHLIDPATAMFARLPGAHSMIGDRAWRRLDQIAAASPCGLILLCPQPGDWHMSTPLVLVVAGIVTNWATLDEWADIEEAARSKGTDAWDLADHPIEPCQALHCRLVQAASKD